MNLRKSSDRPHIRNVSRGVADDLEERRLMAIHLNWGTCGPPTVLDPLVVGRINSQVNMRIERVFGVRQAFHRKSLLQPDLEDCVIALTIIVPVSSIRPGSRRFLQIPGKDGRRAADQITF
ncbi:hypothetical protein ACHAPK_011437 [Fusarium culmorum]